MKNIRKQIILLEQIIEESDEFLEEISCIIFNLKFYKYLNEETEPQFKKMKKFFQNLTKLILNIINMD